MTGTPERAGLSGDHGWGDVDEPRLVGLTTPLMMIAHGAYWAVLWGLSGLVPLPLLATRVRWRRSRGDSLGRARDGSWKVELP